MKIRNHTLIRFNITVRNSVKILTHYLTEIYYLQALDISVDLVIAVQK